MLKFTFKVVIEGSGISWLSTQLDRMPMTDNAKILGRLSQQFAVRRNARDASIGILPE